MKIQLVNNGEKVFESSEVEACKDGYVFLQEGKRISIFFSKDNEDIVVRCDGIITAQNFVAPLKKYGGVLEKVKHA